MKKYRNLRKPYKARRKKSILKKRGFWLFILFLAAVAGIFYFLFFASFLQIKKIEISGTKSLPNQEIQNLTEKDIVKKILFFPTKSILLANKKEIIEKLSKNFPKIDEIRVKKRLPNILILEIKEKEKTGCFCGENNCFYADAKGIIFEEAGNSCPLKFIIRISESALNLSEQVIEEALLDKIKKINNNARENIRIDIAEFNISELSNEKIIAKTKSGWEIYFNPEGDIDWQLTKLAQVLEKEIPPEKRENLEYIDLRFGNFAPYKYRD